MSTNGPEPATTITATLTIPPNALRVMAPPPDTISQRNVEAVTGIPARVYLEAIRSPGFPVPVTRLGKLRIVTRSAFVAWLQNGALVGEASPRTQASDAATSDDTATSDVPPTESADGVLAALGLKARSKQPTTPRKATGRSRRT
jgi:hypothetical protein